MNTRFSNCSVLSYFRSKTVLTDGTTILTKQQNEVSRAVLTYYLTEKALISAAVSIVDDNLPGLSLEFLRAAGMYMGDLDQRIGKQHPRSVP
jgi:hypothetical protein